MEQTNRSESLCVHDQVHPLADAILYCTRRANGSSFSGEIRQLRSRCPGMASETAELFEPVMALESRLDALADQMPQDRLHYFFDELGSFPTRSRRSRCPNLANALFQPYALDGSSDDPTQLCAQLLAQSPEEIGFGFRTAFSMPNETWKPRECGDFGKLYDYILTCPASDSEQLRILSAVRQFPECVQELQTLLSPLSEEIRRSIPALEGLLDRFRDRYCTMQPRELVEEGGDVPILDLKAQEFELYPRIFSTVDYFTMTYQMDSTSPVCNRLEIGLLYDVILQCRQQELSAREVAACVKAIGDPVRLQILMLMKDREVYIQELTDLLGLSFTTVSHHMTKLANAGLIRSERRGVCVYYQSNTAFLSWILERLDQFLLP